MSNYNRNRRWGGPNSNKRSGEGRGRGEGVSSSRSQGHNDDSRSRGTGNSSRVQEIAPIPPVETAPAIPELIDDDWGLSNLPPRPAYVYKPAWAKDFPHLLTNPPKHTIDPNQLWRLGLSHSDDEDEEVLSGGSNAVNKKMPSATLTSSRPNYPNIPETVGDFQHPLMDKSLWSITKTAVPKPKAHAIKRLEEAERQLAGEVEDDVDIKYDVDKYQPTYSKTMGVKYTSFVPPLPKHEDFERARKEKNESEQAKLEEHGVTDQTGDGSDSDSSDSADTVVEVEQQTLQSVRLGQQGHEAKIDDHVRRAPAEPMSNRDASPKNLATIHDISQPLSPVVPFKARLRGFLDEGYTLIRFCDNATKAQYKHLQDNILYYFKGTNKSDLAIPDAQIAKGMLVFAESPATKGAIVRARILNTTSEKREAFCKDLDTWNYEKISYDAIYFMPPAFLDTPFLMHRCRMKGIEFWCNGMVIKELAPMLPYTSENITITNYETDLDGVPLVEIEVTLQKGIKNRTGPEDTSMLAELFKNAIVGFTRVPRQFVKGMLIEKAHITNVDTKGNAWVVLHSAIHQRLATIGENPRRALTSAEFNPTLGTDKPLTDFEYAFFNLREGRFLARFEEDRGLFRVEIDNYEMGDKKVKVYYIDFGNTAVIPVEDVIPSQLVDPLINRVSSQVFKGHLNGIASIRDEDEFFNHITIQVPQRIAVAGFKDPNATVLLDVDTQLESEPVPVDESTEDAEENLQDKENWVYVNQYIVDKELATAESHGVIPFRPFGSGEDPHEKTLRYLAMMSLAEKRAKKRAEKLCLRGQRVRFYSSCRIEQEDDGQYAYVTIKDRKRLLPTSGLDPISDDDEE